MENNQWMRAEIAQWLREGLINDEQAMRLYARYPVVSESSGRGAKLGGTRWGKVVFSALGVVIFGLGVILVFAYNWEAMHRYTKLAVIGLSLVLAHGAGLWLHRRDRHPLIVDSLHLLGTMLFGAGVILISQIYHINGYYPDLFLTWSLVALASAWLLPSVAQGMLAAVLIVFWVGLEIVEFEVLNHWGSWLILLALLPLAWRERSRPLLALCLVLFPVSLSFLTHAMDEALMLVSWLWLAASYIALGRLAPTTRFPDSAGSFRTLGRLLLIPLLFLATFADIADTSLTMVLDGKASTLYYGLLLALVLLSWGWVMLQAGSRPKAAEWFEAGMVCLFVLVVLVLTLNEPMPTLVRSLANLLVLGYALLLIYWGTDQVRWKVTTLGCALLAALVFARFNDLFESLLARAMVFLLLGGVLFLVGLRYSKQSERQKIMRSRHA